MQNITRAGGAPALNDDASRLNVSEQQISRGTAADTAAERLRTLGEMAFNVSHEFNNVLHVIAGFTELSRNATDADSRQLFAGEISAAVHKAQQLNQQILAFGTGTAQQPGCIRLSKLITNSRLFLQMAVGNDIRLKLDYDTDVMLRLSELHFCQMLTNLCLNARHAIAQQQQCDDALQGQISIHCHQLPDPAWLSVIVADNGCGMSRAVQTQMFEPGFSTRAAQGGSGLGLALLLQQLSVYNGKVSVRSRPAQGSIITLMLPVITDAPLNSNTTPASLM